MPGVPDPQHVAFATDDVFASARALRAAGAPLLTVPGNYYDDLDSRLALEPELLARMRDHGVLHDRDEHGEFFHLCTEVLGSRLFFEVVQRIGGYTGCGEANASPCAWPPTDSVEWRPLIPDRRLGGAPRR
jgi:4-hydroxyphenylpyruvate dioxygenase